MTKTQRKEIERAAKALIEKTGGVVKAAAKLGVTTVTLNNLLLGQRLYAKTEARLAKKFGVEITEGRASSKTDDEAPKKKSAKKVAKVKAAPKKKAKRAAPKKKAAPTPKKARKPKAKTAASNGVTGPSEAATSEPTATADATAE